MICALCLIPIMFINPVTAGDGKSPIKTEASVENIYGRWINKDYNQYFGFFGKMIVNQENIRIFYMYNSPEYSYIGGWIRYTIADSWVDFLGNSWYKIKWYEETDGKECINYDLWKLSNKSNILELASRAFDYPLEIDPYSYRTTYRKYYRQ